MPRAITCCVVVALFPAVSVGCDRRKETIISRDPIVADAAPLTISEPIGELAAHRAVASLAPSMADAAPDDGGLWPGLKIWSGAPPADRCSPADATCVWKFEIRVVGVEEHKGRIVELCDVHVYSGVVRCGQVHVVNGERVWTVVGNAGGVHVDAATD